jgi:hypothetical protein
MIGEALNHPFTDRHCAVWLQKLAIKTATRYTWLETCLLFAARERFYEFQAIPQALAEVILNGMRAKARQARYSRSGTRSNRVISFIEPNRMSGPQVPVPEDT